MQANDEIVSAANKCGESAGDELFFAKSPKHDRTAQNAVDLY